MSAPLPDEPPADDAETVDGRQRRGAPWPPWSAGWALGGFVAGLAGAIVLGGIAVAITGDTESLVVMAASLAGLWGGYVGAAVLASRRDGSGQPARDLRLRIRGRDLLVGLGAGLASSIVLVRLVYFVLVSLGVISSDDLARLSEPARRVSELADGPGWVVLVALAGLGAPFIEELFYRGLLQPALIRRWGPAGGIVVTAVVFGIAHQQPLQFPALAAFGVVLGWLAWRYGRLGPSIVAHIVFNLLTLAQLALTT